MCRHANSARMLRACAGGLFGSTDGLIHSALTAFIMFASSSPLAGLSTCFFWCSGAGRFREAFCKILPVL